MKGGDDEPGGFTAMIAVHQTAVELVNPSLIDLQDMFFLKLSDDDVKN